MHSVFIFIPTTVQGNKFLKRVKVTALLLMVCPCRRRCLINTSFCCSTFFCICITIIVCIMVSHCFSMKCQKRTNTLTNDIRKFFLRELHWSSENAGKILYGSSGRCTYNSIQRLYKNLEIFLRAVNHSAMQLGRTWMTLNFRSSFFAVSQEIQ